MTHRSHVVLPEDRHGEDVEEKTRKEELVDQRAGGRAGIADESVCGSAAPAPPSGDGSTRDSELQPDEMSSCFGRSGILGNLNPGRSLSPLPVRSIGMEQQVSRTPTATSQLHSTLDGEPSRVPHASLDGLDESLNGLHSTHMQTGSAPERNPIRRRALPANDSVLVKSWERSSQNTEIASSNFSSTML